MKTKVESNQLTCPKWNNTINKLVRSRWPPLKKRNKHMLVEWYVARTNQIATLGYVSRTNYITAFAYLELITTFRVCVWHKSDCRIRVYISHSHITAKGCLGPVTAFGNCFLANDLIELGGCTQRIEKNCNFWAQL